MWQFECVEYLKLRNIGPIVVVREVEKSIINKKREVAGRYLSAGQGADCNACTFLANNK